jgi:hypothetical protein
MAACLRSLSVVTRFFSGLTCCALNLQEFSSQVTLSVKTSFKTQVDCIASQGGRNTRRARATFHTLNQIDRHSPIQDVSNGRFLAHLRPLGRVILDLRI